MTTINERTLTLECESIVEAAIDEYREYGRDGDDIDDFVQQYVWETVDGHQWVIYYGYAHDLCQHCETDRGTDWLNEIGAQPTSYDDYAVWIAFGEMYSRCMEIAYDAIENMEDDDETTTAEAA